MTTEAPQPKGRRPGNKLEVSGQRFIAVAQLCGADVGRVRMSRRVVALTTGCAVLLPVLVGPYALQGGHHVPHEIFLMVMAFDAVLLYLEVQQFAAGASASNWEHLTILERDFLHHRGPLRSAGTPRRSSTAEMRVALTAWRLRRVYLWMFCALLVGWFLKLNHGVSGHWNAADIIDRAAIGVIAGSLVCGVVLVFYSALVFIAVIVNDPDVVVGDPIGGFGSGDQSWQ